MKDKVTKKAVEREIRKFARKVSAEDVLSTVKQERTFRRLFSCVEVLSRYGDDVKLVFSMLKDYMKGRYTVIPWRSITVLVGVLAYVLSPVDLIPDFIPVVGWSDDCLALAGVLAFVRRDLEDYRAWKAQQA